MSTILTIDELNLHFGGVKAVKDVSLEVEENELRSIIGPNGAGKTTLLNVITGRLPATSGKVFYLGKDITNKHPHELIKLGICRTFQISSLFLGSTVFENVRIAKQAKRGGSLRVFSAKESLKDVNEETLLILERLGLMNQAYVPAQTLSYGDQRLLEVGITLAGEPKILLLDEPTAGMSHGETNRTVHLIREIANEATIMLVEHDMEVVMSVSDKISVMDQGRIIAEGTPEEIRGNKQVRKAYLGDEE